jgi:hypothetical protein
MSTRALNIVLIGGIVAGAYWFWKRKQQTPDMGFSGFGNKSGTSQPAMGMFPSVGFLAPGAFNGTNVHS